MWPTLREGDTLLGIPLLEGETRKKVACGDIVVAITRRDGGPDIKRVDAVTETGLRLLGDNALASTDSRAYGDVPWASVRAKIVCFFVEGTRA